MYSKKFEYDAIELQQAHPIRIKYDSYNHNLIILHDKWGAGNNYYSIYSLEDASVKTILLDTKI